MNVKFQKENSNIKLTKSSILRSQISFKKISSFFIWITLYYVLNLSLNFLHVYFLTQMTTSLINIPVIINSVIFICFVSVFIYYKKNIFTSGNDLSVLLLDLWGYTIIITKILPILLIWLNHTDLPNMSLIITFGILIGIGICILATSLLIKSRMLIIICVIYLLLANVYYTIPDIAIKLDHQLTLIYPGYSMFSEGLISCVCLFLLSYFNMKGKTYEGCRVHESY